MQEEIALKPEGARISSRSPQSQRQHISDSQFQFSYDLPPDIKTRPLTVPTGAPLEANQPFKLKRNTRRPDGNPVTGEGYEPQDYRPSHYGPLKVLAGGTGDLALGIETLSPNEIEPVSGKTEADSNLNPQLRPTAQRPSSSAGKVRVPPGGYSNGLW